MVKFAIASLVVLGFCADAFAQYRGASQLRQQSSFVQPQQQFIQQHKFQQQQFVQPAFAQKQFFVQPQKQFIVAPPAQQFIVQPPQPVLVPQIREEVSVETVQVPVQVQTRKQFVDQVEVLPQTQMFLQQSHCPAAVVQFQQAPIRQRSLNISRSRGGW